MTRKFYLLAACVLAWISPAAYAELRIEINQGVERPVPIAVVPFGWKGSSGSAPFDVGALIAADLAGSGRFAPMSRGDMLQKPTRGRDIDFGDWRILGTEVIIVGQLIPTGADRYSIQFQVFDVFRGDLLLGYRLPTDRASLRMRTRRAADMIYEKLTGIPGAFSTRIAYVSVVRTGGKPTYRLIVQDADGANEQRMLRSSDPIMSPVWSPDGRKLAYVSFESDQSEIYIQTLRSGARQRVSARAGVNGAPAWSPDGRKLALTLSKSDGNLDIYTLDLATQVLRRLTDLSSIDTEPVWSPDGRTIYFTSDRAGGPQIYRVSSGGGRAKRVTFEGNYNARPRISPDGKQLAVVHNDRGSYKIALVDMARSYVQVLTKGPLDESPSFAPNGETLIYAAQAGNQGVLAMTSTDGRIHRRISSVEGDVREPAWSPYPVN